MSKTLAATISQAAAQTGDGTTDQVADQHQTPNAHVAIANYLDAAALPPLAASAWAPRINASHLAKGPNGIWYMRLAVPAQIRARHPELPKELKRSTKVALKSLALVKSRQMCLDFFVKYSPGAPMLTLDEKSDQSFALFYEDGKVRLDHSRSANAETLILMTRCFERMMHQVLGRGQRSANDQSMSTVQATMPPMPAVTVSAPPPLAASLPQQTITADAEGPWLSDAIDDWLENGGTKFSDLSWKNSYEPSFRVFRELIGDVRRDRAARDGTHEFGILDIQLHRLTRTHIQAFHDGLKCLPANQGCSTKTSEAHERIRQGLKEKVKRPSLSSVDKKLGHVAPFISYASSKDWIGLEVVSQMTLATQSAKANLVKASKNTTRKKGSIALSDAELKKMFHQPAFLDGAMHAAWRYWIPQICLYQGARVSEGSGLYTDDIIIVDGIHCMSFIPDDPEGEDDADGDIEDKDRVRKVMAKSSEEYRRLKNKFSRRIVPIHPKLIELGFLDFVNAIRDYSSHPSHLFYGLRWDEKTMFGRKPSRYMRGLIEEAGFYVARRKVPHSLRSNFHQQLDKTLLGADLQKRLLGHSTGAMKDDKYNETDQGPAFPVAQVLPFLAKVDFDLKVPTWSEVQQQERIVRAQGTLKRPVAGS